MPQAVPCDTASGEVASIHCLFLRCTQPFDLCLHGFDLLYMLIIAQMAVYCNEKGVKKCVGIDFFGAVWYNYRYSSKASTMWRA